MMRNRNGLPSSRRLEEVNSASVCPQIDEKLLEYLSTVFPPPTVRPDISHEELLFRGGAAAVITFLDNQRKAQQDNV
jgi:hypothetical protein